MLRLTDQRTGGNGPPESHEPWCRPSAIEVGSTRISAPVAQPGGPPRKPLPRFVFEAAVGVALFALLMGAAAALSAVVWRLEAQDVDLSITWGLRAAAHAVFAIGCGLFVRFSWRTSRRAWKLR